MEGAADSAEDQVGGQVDSGSVDYGHRPHLSAEDSGGPIDSHYQAGRSSQVGDLVCAVVLSVAGRAVQNRRCDAGRR